MAAMNYYEILGVDIDAEEDEIRKAFRRLVGELHPDRFSGAERVKAEARFQTITEAFNVLRNPESRDNYDKELSPGKEGNSRVLSREDIARKYAAKGAQLYREGDLAGAREALQRAIDHDPKQARAHFFLGQILSRIPDKAREGVRYLEQASRMEPQNLLMKSELAVAYVGIGLFSRAERLASEILGLDPTNEKAQNVLVAVRAAKNGTGR